MQIQVTDRNTSRGPGPQIQIQIEETMLVYSDSGPGQVIKL